MYIRGVRNGRKWRESLKEGGTAEAAAEAAQQSWRQIAQQLNIRPRSWTAAFRLGSRYVSGFWRGAGIKGRLVPIPLRGTAGAVLYAPRLPATLRYALRRLRKLPLREIVVALPGNASSELLEAVRTQPDVTAVYRPDLNDPGAARALTAALTQSDIILFADGERLGKAEQLAWFIWACDNGLDVALNDLSGQLGLFRQRKNPHRHAEFLNRALNRRDLRASSLANAPFALTRRALDTIGPDLLASPAKAQAAALSSGLRIGIGGSVPLNAPSADASARETAEYAEAWKTALEGRDARLTFPDRVRNRKLLEEWA